MKSGSKACPFCRSRFTFEDYELVDAMPSEAACEGCVRLYAILAESARLKALFPPDDQPAAMDLSPSANLARLQAGRPQKPVFDPKLAAAGRDE